MYESYCLFLPRISRISSKVCETLKIFLVSAVTFFPGYNANGKKTTIIYPQIINSFPRYVLSLTKDSEPFFVYDIIHWYNKIYCTRFLVSGRVTRVLRNCFGLSNKTLPSSSTAPLSPKKKKKESGR